MYDSYEKKSALNLKSSPTRNCCMRQVDINRLKSLQNHFNIGSNYLLTRDRIIAKILNLVCSDYFIRMYLLIIIYLDSTSCISNGSENCFLLYYLIAEIIRKVLLKSIYLISKKRQILVDRDRLAYSSYT